MKMNEYFIFYIYVFSNSVRSFSNWNVDPVYLYEVYKRKKEKGKGAVQTNPLFTQSISFPKIYYLYANNIDIYDHNNNNRLLILVHYWDL